MNQLALNFISSGVCCHCLVYLDQLGLLKALLPHSECTLKQLSKKLPNKQISIRSALITLEKSNVIELKADGEYTFSSFGLDLYEQMPLINILFKGYVALMAQSSCSYDPSKMRSLIDGHTIAEASIPFSQKYIYPIVQNEIKNRSVHGSICDLGCGSAGHLIELCKTLRLKGVGIDIDASAVQLALQNTMHLNDIRIIHGDVTAKLITDPLVEVLMQWHVLHDVDSEKECLRIIDSTLDCFENLKCFFYIDIVSPSQKAPNPMPGFDFVHGLQNIQTRSYEKTHEMLSQSRFNIEKEIAIEQMPNTFCWILSPKKRASAL